MIIHLLTDTFYHCMSCIHAVCEVVAYEMKFAQRYVGTLDAFKDAVGRHLTELYIKC